MNYSKQREQILSVVKENLVHPDAKFVYSTVKEQNPSISLATVYRNLNLLAQMGLILKISMPNASDRYDGTIKEHYHIVCNECGKVEDVELGYFKHLDEEINRKASFQVTSHELIVRGICEECQKEKNKFYVKI